VLAAAAALFSALAAGTGRADPVRMRYPEGPTHGFLILTDTAESLYQDGPLWRIAPSGPQWSR
jgi:hypothetical protein